MQILGPDRDNFGSDDPLRRAERDAQQEVPHPSATVKAVPKITDSEETKVDRERSTLAEQLLKMNKSRR